MSDSPGRMATVLQVLPALGAGGGVERGTVEIARAITEAGGRALVASSGGPLVHDLTRIGADHIELPMHTKSPTGIWSNIGKLEQLIREQNVDIVHARSRAPAWSAYYASKRTKARFLTTFHGTYSSGNMLKRQYNSVMTRGQKMIAISRFIAGHARRIYGVPGSKIRIIHRGVDLDKFDPHKVSAERVINLANSWRLTDGLPVVMLPGRLTRWKGQTVFIEAIASLKRRDIRCLLVGGDQGRSEYRSELEALVNRHDLNEVVRIVDHCDDMSAAYMQSDIVVSASTDPEAFGRVMIEGQAMGRTVIASNHGGAQESIIDGKTGFLAEPGDSEALAKAIHDALAMNENQRNTLVEAAQKNARDNFSLQRMSEKTLEVYDELLQLGPMR